MNSAFLKEEHEEKTTYVSLAKFKELESKVDYQAAQIKILREALEFYGDPEHWMIKENAGWRHSSPRSYLDEEMILGYKHPYSDWVGTIKPGGKRARQALAEIDKMKGVKDE